MKNPAQELLRTLLKKPKSHEKLETVFGQTASSILRTGAQASEVANRVLDGEIDERKITNPIDSGEPTITILSRPM